MLYIGWGPERGAKGYLIHPGTEEHHGVRASIGPYQSEVPVTIDTDNFSFTIIFQAEKEVPGKDRTIVFSLEGQGELCRGTIPNDNLAILKLFTGPVDGAEMLFALAGTNAISVDRLSGQPQADLNSNF